MIDFCMHFLRITFDCIGSSDVNGAPQLSQVAFIKNCTFIRNSAEEFGAAVCLNSLLFLVDTSGVAPIRIEDW